MDKLLALAIPTYNRSRFLRRLLLSIKEQYIEDSDIGNHLDIYVFDNDSPDDTEKLVKSSGLPIIYKKNHENIGGDRNILQAYSMPKAKYIWVMGDDELIVPGAIKNILKNLSNENPSLLLLKDNDIARRKAYEKQLIHSYPNYAKFIDDMIEKRSPLMDHSLIARNVLLSSLFDKDKALSKIKTSYYSHMYGLLNKLTGNGMKIILTEYPAIQVVEDHFIPEPSCDPVGSKYLSVQSVYEMHSVMRRSYDEYRCWTLSKFSSKPAHPRIFLLRLNLKMEIERWFLMFKSSPNLFVKNLLWFVYYKLYDFKILRTCIFEPLKRMTGIKRKR